MIQLTETEIVLNTIFLILLAISSLMVLVNRLDDNSKNNNIITKLLYGSLSIVSLGGLFYPVSLALIGVNIIVTFIMIVEFFRYDKNIKKNKW